MNASRLLPLAATLCALAFPLAAHAEGNSQNNNGNNGHHEKEAGNNGNNGNNGHENDPGTAPVPEPAAWLSMGTLAAGAAVYARRQMKQRKNAY